MRRMNNSWRPRVSEMTPTTRIFSGRARHFSQTGSNRPLLTQAENGDALPSLGDQEPHSYDATAFLTPKLSASARYFRLCGAQRPRNVNFSNLGKLPVAEAAGVQRRQRHGNTMIGCAVWRVWVLRMSVCSSRSGSKALDSADFESRSNNRSTR